MKKALFFLGLIVGQSAMLFAQDEVSADPFEGYSNAVLIVPQYAAISGMRIDYERKLKNGNKWMVFAPQFYLDNNGYDAYDKVQGLGLNVYYKKFLHHSDRKNHNGLARTTLYFSAGPTYQYFSLSTIEQVSSQFVEDGVTYYGFSEKEKKTPINKFGANANFGLQIAFSSFILDFYGGIGLRYAIDENGNTVDFFNDAWVDLGYSGFLLDGGIRLGIFIQ